MNELNNILSTTNTTIVHSEPILSEDNSFLVETQHQYVPLHPNPFSTLYSEYPGINIYLTMATLNGLPFSLE